MVVKKILELSKIKGTNKYDRKKVGYFSGLIGTFLNVSLAISKLIIGILVHSIAITADAVNNFSDAVYSSATILGFKISAAPPDRDHPYGHGRVEYITTLIISMMIMLVGIQFAKTSLDRIINPRVVVINKIGIVFLVISILIKIWMSVFNRKLSKEINSSILKATSFDCLTDVFTTSVVLLAMICANYTVFPVDGIVGLVVSIFVLLSGFSLARETVSQLIGELPDSKLIKSVLEDILSYEGVIGVHNYTFHRYGHLKTIATVDVEVPAEMRLVKAHNLVSVIEKEIYEKYDIELITHIEPIGGNFTETELELQKIICDWKNNFEYIKSMHDFAIYKANEGYFLGIELVIDGNKLRKNFDDNILKSELNNLIKTYDKDLNSVITILYDYV